MLIMLIILDIGCGGNPLFCKGEVIHADLSGGAHLEVKCMLTIYLSGITVSRSFTPAT